MPNNLLRLMAESRTNKKKQFHLFKITTTALSASSKKVFTHERVSSGSKVRSDFLRRFNEILLVICIFPHITTSLLLKIRYGSSGDVYEFFWVIVFNCEMGSYNLTPILLTFTKASSGFFNCCVMKR